MRKHRDTKTASRAAAAPTLRVARVGSARESESRAVRIYMLAVLAAALVHRLWRAGRPGHRVTLLLTNPTGTTWPGPAAYDCRLGLRSMSRGRGTAAVPGMPLRSCDGVGGHGAARMGPGGPTIQVHSRPLTAAPCCASVAWLPSTCRLAAGCPRAVLAARKPLNLGETTKANFGRLVEPWAAGCPRAVWVPTRTVMMPHPTFPHRPAFIPRIAPCPALRLALAGAPPARVNDKEPEVDPGCVPGGLGYRLVQSLSCPNQHVRVEAVGRSIQKMSGRTRIRS
jgi:hypothetical protein